MADIGECFNEEGEATYLLPSSVRFGSAGLIGAAFDVCVRQRSPSGYVTPIDINQCPTWIVFVFPEAYMKGPPTGGGP